MKVVQINVTCGVGSTGKISLAISKTLTENNIENYVMYGVGKSNYKLAKKISNKFYNKVQALKSKMTGKFGFTATRSTNRIIRELEKIKPDCVILHNLHSHFVNVEKLFKYLKQRSELKIYWVFHDCWAFTGYCTHFTYINCTKWQSGCHKCSKAKYYYTWFKDRSKKLYDKKKELFSDLNLEIITPSKWLKDLVEKSIFKDYKVTVINNGIDLGVFKPTPSNFRKDYNIPDNKFVILGVAFDWGTRKGLDVFVELSKKLDDDIYQIVLVGTNDKIDKQLPKNIITIHRTQSQQELAKIYTAVDLFFNPTREEVFGLVNVEANACGIPVLTFNTGGSPECIDETSGSVVPCDDIQSSIEEIQRIYKTKPYEKQACIQRAKLFNYKDKSLEYKRLLER